MLYDEINSRIATADPLSHCRSVANDPLGGDQFVCIRRTTRCAHVRRCHRSRPCRFRRGTGFAVVAGHSCRITVLGEPHPGLDHLVNVWRHAEHAMMVFGAVRISIPFGARPRRHAGD